MKKMILLVLVLVLGLATEFANADYTFGTPVNLGPEVNSSYGEGGVCISANGLEFYFTSDRPGGSGGQDIWVMKRPTIDDDWGDPLNLGSPANTKYSYWEPSISSDGLSLYFSDGHWPPFGNRLPGGLGGQGDIWMITRETIHDAWSAPVNIGPAVNSQNAVHPSISADGLSLYFQSHRSGSLGGHCDIMVATRESTSDSFGSPVFLGNVNSTNGEWMPDISADGRTLFFSRSNATEIWVAMRETIYDDFGPPLKLPSQINISSYLNNSPSLSTDSSTLYFGSDRPGGVGSYDLWQVSINPAVDLNGDGIVDSADMCIVVDHWGEDYPLCDIGPMPWGDGIVDVQDLIVLAEHLFEVLPSAETVDVNEDDNGGQIELELGEILVVTLESNPSTGYRWELVEDNESILKQFGEVEFKSSETSEPPIVDASGLEIFRFKAVSTGQMTLELIYHRSWEDVEPLKTFSIQVVVP
ncbi:MAG: protease inhibitor I42 family protein [Planctomycetota bacterium]|jgi:predicted secreted protein/Tol biopolymer transport system component